MVTARATTGLGRLSMFVGMVLIGIAIFVLNVPDADAGRSRGGGVRQSGGKAGGTRSGSTTRQKPSGTQTRKKSSSTQTRKKSSNKQKKASRAGSKKGGRAHQRSHARYSSRGHSRSSYRRWHRRRVALFGLGVYLATRPRYTTTVVVTGTSYYYWGGAYYVASGSGYVVVAAPVGAVVHAVPTYTTLVYVGSTPYYYYGGTYYVATAEPAPVPEEPPEDEVLSEDEQGPPMTEDDHNYEVVGPPVGVTVPYLPDEVEEKTINGTLYYVYDNTYYRAFVSDGDTIYQVVEAPE